MTKAFSKRHIGIQENDLPAMLQTIKVSSINQLIKQTIPEEILEERSLNIGAALNEHELLQLMRKIASKNRVWTSYIGMGYYNTVTPAVIQRNILENPAWYTQYTPYQAEIAQGRLEALFNFQTVITDLTGLGLANASLLDEATAAAEAMDMFYNYSRRQKDKKQAQRFFVDENSFQTTKDVLETRALPLGIKIVYGDANNFKASADFFGAFIQNPGDDGSVRDYTETIAQFHSLNILVCLATDLMALCLMKSPGEMNADCAIGNTQRFGVPLGFGGPHAAYFACKEEFLRYTPGRIVGLSKDAQGNNAYRLALQTREQHIKRERATSNICTAEALLAIMAGLYALWHGPEGLKSIALEIYRQTQSLKDALMERNINLLNEGHFDTLTMRVPNLSTIVQRAEKQQVNLRIINDNTLGVSLDETTSRQQVDQLLKIITGEEEARIIYRSDAAFPRALQRQSDYLTHPIFQQHQSETQMMRYMKSLEMKEMSLVHSMIPLGSCTMKLNSAVELTPITWPEFAQIHPFVPQEQAQGYHQIIEELEAYLADITGFIATSLQPNSGAQGEYTGLLTIRAYHHHQGQENRRKMLIPASAHGTNPASAVLAGFDVVIVKINEQGAFDMADLSKKLAECGEDLAGIMITYPSTNGIFDEGIKSICAAIHDQGGLVYLDGANMNAQVGFTSPGFINADVCHLNLHKTFAIPHGGGGPGVGPICVNEKLAPFLPKHSQAKVGGMHGINAVSNAAWGSANILLISYAYIRLLGNEGLKNASAYAILNANYLANALQDFYPILYRGAQGRVAHEFIIDLRPFKKSAGIEAEDVAKRLMDYGFHAPTMSWPVPGTIMIEPTESESKEELDRFIEAMIGIRKEIEKIENKHWPMEDNPLKNSPHTVFVSNATEWSHSYSREQAVFPTEATRQFKFWPAVGRVDNSYGDRNLVCSCPPVSFYNTDET